MSCQGHRIAFVGASKLFGTAAPIFQPEYPPALAVLKDKTKSTAKKFKSKVYGVTDLLKTKID